MNTILMGQLIEHDGIIQSIQNNHIQVSILQQSACGDCHSKNVCSVSDKTEKIVEVEYVDADIEIGDKVILIGSQSIGLTAVLVAFVIPFMLILITLLGLNTLISNEVYAGLIAIAALIPYYFILSLFKNKFKSKFKFTLKKANE
jgi:sigma-E factor negative regulatory protein RseC